MTSSSGGTFNETCTIKKTLTKKKENQLPSKRYDESKEFWPSKRKVLKYLMNKNVIKVYVIQAKGQLLFTILRMLMDIA